MTYTSGIIRHSDARETLEQLQENKMRLVCEKVQLKQGDRHLDIGCGWGTLTAAKNYRSDSTGTTLAKNQKQFGSKRCQSMESRKPHVFTCLEIAEHVGICRFQEFLLEAKDIL
ncbi:hypothetical protein K7432_014116 [Basidiobolus ranarum]|uniref:sphingolipid C(9)-methyltransferase n=1 Tax=Basidiobolus ranarum TaxID=34480 RepID=A0ABR2WI52_9FUNG